MLRFWKTSAAATAIRQEVGILEDSGNEITCTGTPDHVRKFSSTNYWGLLLTDSVDYSVDTAGGTAVITLTAALTAGETVVAINAGEYIFQGLNVKGNSALEADRTMQQQLWIHADGVNATDVEITIGDYLSGHGLATTMHYLAPDVGGSPGSYEAAGASLTIGDIDDGNMEAFWVKCIVTLGTAMDNYHDIHLTAQSVEFSTHE